MPKSMENIKIKTEEVGEGKEAEASEEEAEEEEISGKDIAKQEAGIKVQNERELAEEREKLEKAPQTSGILSGRDLRKVGESIEEKSLSEMERYLLSFDPSLVEYADNFEKSKTRSPIKDLRDWKEFDRGEKELTEKDIVLVHKTNYFPKNGVIQPRVYSDPCILRDTVHFSLNGPVSSHMYGNWDNSKYTIIIPFDKLDKETRKRVGNFNPSDTYIVGHVKLPKGSVILGGEKGQDKLKNAERDVYKKIIEMGYCPMKVGMWNWDGWNVTSTNVFTKTAKKLCIKHGYETHSNSLFHFLEDYTKKRVTEGDEYKGDIITKQILDEFSQYLEDRIVSAKKYFSLNFADSKKEIDFEVKFAKEFEEMRPELEKVWKESMTRKKAQNAIEKWRSEFSKKKQERYGKVYIPEQEKIKQEIEEDKKSRKGT